MEKRRPFALLMLGLEALFIGYMAYLTLKPVPGPEQPSVLEEKVDESPLQQFLLYEDSANVITHPCYLKPYKQ